VATRLHGGGGLKQDGDETAGASTRSPSQLIYDLQGDSRHCPSSVMHAAFSTLRKLLLEPLFQRCVGCPRVLDP